MDKKNYILITGSSSGIGKNIAINLSKEYNVILHGRNIEKLFQVKNACCPDNEQVIWQYDLRKIDKLEENLTAFIIENKIDVKYFVHCAGAMKMLPLKMVSLASLNETFAVNVFSAALICRILTQRKINGDFLKSVVFISSNISNFGAKAFSVYASSKGALDSLMRCLAVELAPKVRVNSVLPGGVRTEMTEHLFENTELIERMALAYPLGLGKPEYIMDMVTFLLSEKSSWITGQQFTVDGGRTVNITE